MEVQLQQLHPRSDGGTCWEATKLTNHQKLYKYLTRLGARLRIRQTNDSISSGSFVGPPAGDLGAWDRRCHSFRASCTRSCSFSNLAFLHVAAMEISFTTW